MNLLCATVTYEKGRQILLPLLSSYFSESHFDDEHLLSEIMAVGLEGNPGVSMPTGRKLKMGP